MIKRHGNKRQVDMKAMNSYPLDHAKSTDPLVDSEAVEITDAEFDALEAKERKALRRKLANQVKSSNDFDDDKKKSHKHGSSRPHMPGHFGGRGPMHKGEKPKNFKKTISRLLQFISQFKFRLLLVFVFAIGSTIFSVIGPKVMSGATTTLFEGAVAKINGTGGIDFTLIATILIATLVLYLISAACSWVQGWIMSYISQQTCYRLREAIAQKIDRLPYGYFEKTSTGDTLSRITNDVDTLGQSLNQGVTQLITSLVTVIGVIVMMFSINWIMTLIALVIVPISLLIVFLVVRKSQKYFYAQQSLLGQVNAQAEETFSGHDVVSAFGKEDETVNVYVETNDRLYEAGWKSIFLSGFMRPLMDFVANLGYIAIAISGAFFAVAGIITVGDIQAFIQYVQNFTRPIAQLAQVSNVFQQLAAAAERIFEFIDEPEPKLPESTASTDDIQCDIDFDDISFGYDEASPVIQDFKAYVKEGDTVAIVGPTGAGKTTIVKLLMRFYDVDSGKILIGGHNIEDYPLDQERELFAMVLQDTWLFKGTIADNIKYGKLDATQDEIVAAAHKACAHHFITTLPGAYDFEINEDASNISQGQRQLLTIARAILADRRMLILDEATSSVDTRTERRIQEAMDNLMRGRTSFVIAHRLSTIKEANLILVIDKGNIIESGTHNELLELNGAYANLYNSQFVK